MWSGVLGTALWIVADRLADRELVAHSNCEIALRPPAWSVELNQAQLRELQVLPGVGPALAERIVRDREVHGAFKGPEDLDRVPGIGPALLERIRPHVR
ncbi:MAG: helix-hairpin-helix domain-containing protein [Planctomycetes bacterium]|nr:helix-hairpin-helix domain-containing protein [Planctomycetota bacterium]